MKNSLFTNVHLLGIAASCAAALLAYPTIAQDMTSARVSGKIVKAGPNKIEEAYGAELQVKKSDPAFQQSSTNAVDSTAKYQLRGAVVGKPANSTLDFQLSAAYPDHVVLPEEMVNVSVSPARPRASAREIILREKGNASRYVLNLCRQKMKDTAFAADRPEAVDEITTCFDRAWSISDKNSGPIEQADFYEKNGYFKECMDYFGDWYTYLDTKTVQDAATIAEKDRALTRRITCSRKLVEKPSRTTADNWSQPQHATLYFDSLQKYSNLKSRNDAVALYNDVFYEISDYSNCVKGYDIYLMSPDTTLDQRFQVSKKSIDCAKRKAEASSQTRDYLDLIGRCAAAIDLDNEIARRAGRAPRGRDRAQIFTNWFDSLLFVTKSGSDVNKFAQAITTDPAMMYEWRRYYAALSKKTVPTTKAKIVEAVSRFRIQQATQ